MIMFCKLIQKWNEQKMGKSLSVQCTAHVKNALIAISGNNSSYNETIYYSLYRLYNVLLCYSCNTNDILHK